MSTPPKPKTNDKQRLLLGVMIAVAVWGSVLALGALLYGPDPISGQVVFAPSIARGGIVLGFVAFFVGGWALLLRGKHSE